MSRAPTHPPSYREAERAIDVPKVEGKKNTGTQLQSVFKAREFSESKKSEKIAWMPEVAAVETFGVTQSARLRRGMGIAL